MAKLTDKEWRSAREIWESCDKPGYAWLARDLSVGRTTVAKRAARECWAKNVTLNSPAVTKTGRPTDYRPEYEGMAYRLMLLGFTREGLADVFDVDVRTIYRWQSEHEGFRHAMWRGGVIADSEVAEALFNRAKGAVTPDTHVAVHEGEVIITPLEKHYPPDTGAARLWLKNRTPLLWKDKVEVVEEVINVFPPTEELDAMYAKTLAQAKEAEGRIVHGRAERLGLVLDGETFDSEGE